MFIWDFAAGWLLDQIIDWIFDTVVGFLGNFFGFISNMGAELFEFEWIKIIVSFFSSFAWALYVVGLVVAVFECAIEYQSGRGSIKDVALNAIKGFFAVSLFSVLPVRLYVLSITLQTSLTAEIAGLNDGIGSLSSHILDNMSSGNFMVGSVEATGIFALFFIILMGYAVIKVFFANLKRGGILLIQIAVGSLYMFSVPRGYMDGFISWAKQVIGLCLTTMLQSVFLAAGLLVAKDNIILGVGLMLSANEIPRIAGAFGLDTSSKASLGHAVQTAHSSIQMANTIKNVVAK